MKRLLATIFIALGIISFQFAPVNAADPLKAACDSAGSTQFCQNKNSESKRAFVDSSDSLLVKIAHTVILITGAISVIMIIVGGFKYVISNGDSNGLQGAKNTILYALVGLIVVLFAQVIVRFVLVNANK